MDVSLLMDLCGTTMFFAIVITSLLVTGVACWLALVVKREHLLTTFLPLCAAPLAIALFGLLADQVAALSTQLSQNGSTLDSALQLQLQLTPLLLGLVASVPPATIVAGSRFWIGLQAVLTQWADQRRKAEQIAAQHAPEHAQEPSDMEQTDEYLERLVRPR